LGKEIYDVNEATFTDASEARDLISVSKPIHEARIRRYIINANHDTDPRVFDPGYNEEGSKKRKTKTSIIDAKEAHERSQNMFNLKEHNKNIAQYRVAGLIDKAGGTLTLEDSARTN
jgi:hypothetical protein